MSNCKVPGALFTHLIPSVSKHKQVVCVSHQVPTSGMQDIGGGA